MRSQRYKMLENKIIKRYPDVQIRYKNEHWFWKRLPKQWRCSGITLNKTIWMPFKDSNFKMLGHEYQHEVDIQEMGFLSFMWMYLSPQIFSLFFFIFAVIALGFSLLHITIIMAAAGVISLLPWPSKSRTWLEMRGYLMTMYIGLKNNTYNNDIMVDVLQSWLYYKMVWTRLHAQCLIDESVQKLDNQEDIPGISVAFRDVYEIINATEKTVL